MDDSRTFWLTQAIKNHPKSQNPPKSSILPTWSGKQPPVAHKTKKTLPLKENSRLTQPERVCTTKERTRVFLPAAQSGNNNATFTEKRDGQSRPPSQHDGGSTFFTAHDRKTPKSPRTKNAGVRKGQGVSGLRRKLFMFLHKQFHTLRVTKN
jgi:hypothetical protein